MSREWRNFWSAAVFCYFGIGQRYRRKSGRELPHSKTLREVLEAVA